MNNQLIPVVNFFKTLVYNKYTDSGDITGNKIHNTSKIKY